MRKGPTAMRMGKEKKGRLHTGWGGRGRGGQTHQTVSLTKGHLQFTGTKLIGHL